MKKSEIQRAVGVFDSGVGGLTVLRALANLLPDENYLYFGDTGRFPYGMKTPDQLRQFTFQIIDFLQAQGVKMIVIACNSASSAALTAAQAHFKIPIIGVIEPGARSALLGSRNRRIGVIGSNATIASNAYRDAILNLDAGAHVFQAPCPELADFAERGETGSERLRTLLQDYLTPLTNESIDSLILGCTHYPLLDEAITKVAGAGVTLINSADEIAKELKEIMVKRGVLNLGSGLSERRFFTTDHSEKLHNLSEKFFGQPIEVIENVELAALESRKYK